MHHEAVGALHHALLLNKGEQLLEHDAHHAELLPRAVQVDGHAPLHQVVAHLSVAVPLGHL